MIHNEGEGRKENHIDSARCHVDRCKLDHRRLQAKIMEQPLVVAMPAKVRPAPAAGTSTAALLIIRLTANVLPADPSLFAPSPVSLTRISPIRGQSA